MIIVVHHHAHHESRRTIIITAELRIHLNGNNDNSSDYTVNR